MSNFLNQPKAFYTIFMLEIWERFGYQSLVALFVVYLQVGSINLSESEAISTYAAFSALIFGFIVIGGYIGDMVLGAKRTIIIGLIVLLCGYILLIIGDKQTTLWGLSFICVGTGLFKSNPTSLLTKCYENNDSGKISNAFTLFYMAINIGSFLGGVFVPNIAKSYGYSFGFVVTSFALILAIVTFVGFGFTMRHISSHADRARLNYRYLVVVISFVLLFTYVVKLLLAYILLAKLVVILTFCISLLIYIFLAFKYKVEGYFYKMILALILMCEAIIYKISVMQIASSINLFTIKNTDHNILGFIVAPETFQSLNPFWIFVLSPILAFYYVKAVGTRFDLAIYKKFSIGLFFIGSAFLVLYFSKFTAVDGVVSSYWLFISYCFQSLGELLISAIGISMFTMLTPSRVNGFMVGVWWTFFAFASILGGFIAQFTSTPVTSSRSLELNISLINYTDFFFIVGLVIVVISFISFSLSPIKKILINK